MSIYTHKMNNFTQPLNFHLLTCRCDAVAINVSLPCPVRAVAQSDNGSREASYLVDKFSRYSVYFVTWPFRVKKLGYLYGNS